MARGELLGLCNCPECGFIDAEIRPDKGGNPYRFCPDCTAQYFSRGVPHKVKNLLAKIRKKEPDKPQAAPVSLPVVPAKADATEKAKPAPAPANPPTPAQGKPAGKPFSFADL